MKNSSTFQTASVGAFVAGLFVSLVAFSVAAQTPASPASELPAAREDARGMLRSDDTLSSLEHKPAAGDFQWAALTENGAANGGDPVIGEGSGKAYYDFKDGLPHPFFVAPGNK